MSMDETRIDALDDGSDDPVLRALLDDGDLDALVREVGNRTTDADWEGLGRLIVRSVAAHDRGRQLWPAATHASHCLVLLGPAEWAVRAMLDGSTSLGLGPLTEVIAQGHSFAELAPQLAGTGTAAQFVVAHECGIRAAHAVADGAKNTVAEEIHAGLEHVADPFGHDPIPASWEPLYPLATYDTWKVETPPPRPATILRTDIVTTTIDRAELTGRDRTDDALAGSDALRAALGAWEDGGSVKAVGVDGSAAEAVAMLCPPDSTAEVSLISAADALAILAYAAALGGPQGRRRGIATGRFDALWTLAELLGVADEWPIHLDELGQGAAELDWCIWRPADAGNAWACRLAIHDPLDGLSWAVEAKPD